MATEKKNETQNATQTQTKTISPLLKAVGIVVPYVYGGTAGNTAQPLLLIPEHETGVVSDEYATPLSRKERDAKFKASDPAWMWFFIGRVVIAGETFKAYGTHQSCSRTTAPEAIDAALGDKLRRASADEARAMAADVVREETERMVAALRERNPALADLDTATMLAMLTGATK